MNRVGLIIKMAIKDTGNKNNNAIKAYFTKKQKPIINNIKITKLNIAPNPPSFICF